MLSKRIIPCLDVCEGRTTKGIKFKNNIDIGDPVAMARAFTLSVQAGRLAHRALPMRTREVAQASTPMVGVPFWHQGS